MVARATMLTASFTLPSLVQNSFEVFSEQRWPCALAVTLEEEHDQSRGGWQRVEPGKEQKGKLTW
eukprot:3550948-Rhodomonas_salina.1